MTKKLKEKLTFSPSIFKNTIKNLEKNVTK